MSANPASNQDLLSAKEQLSQMISGLDGMDAITNVIKSKLKSDATLLEDIPKYLLELGGKRMRPVLTLLVAKALGMDKPTQGLIEVAAGIELIHMATLLHDDIIDNATMRRHEESPLVKFGQSQTLLAGDFLLVRAFSLCAHLDKEIIDATEEACVHLTEGEILETPLYVDQHTRESSLTIADKKTAALFKLAAYSAAHLATRDREVATLLSKFGQSLGIAFQILDDILDVTSDSDLLGKPSGTDIRERKPSIINILWLESGAPSARKLLQEPNSTTEAEFIRDAVKELRNSEVVEQARQLALSYTNDAEEALRAGLVKAGKASDNPAVDALKNIIQYTVNRVI